MPPRKNRGKGKNKNFKRNFKKQRAKRVETKKREHALISIRNSQNGSGSVFSGYYPDTTKPTNITSVLAMMPVRSFYRTSRGNRQDQIEASSAYIKSIYMKGKITGLPASNLVESYLVTGIVTDKLGLSDFTTPTVAQAHRTTVEDFIMNQVKQHFDEKSDEMRYRTAKKDNIKILKYQKLTHPADAAFNNDIDFKAHWRWNRKVTYTQCLQQEPVTDAQPTPDPSLGSNYLFSEINNPNQPASTYVNMTDSHKETGDSLGGDVGQYLPLNSFLPFALIFTPKFADISPGTLQIQYNDVTYFTG